MRVAPYPNQLYSTFSFLGFIMCMIPLPWHIKVRNVGTCLYMLWTGIGCLILSINSIVWHGNAFNPAPIWCDICTRLLIGASIGVPASSLCINRRVYLSQSDPASKSEVRRATAIDLGIFVGLPLLIMILYYIPQGHRFDILEDIGCFPSTYNTWVSVVVVNVPPVLIGLLSATYGVRIIISIIKRRKEFNELLPGQLDVTASMYFRLMCLAGIEALFTVPIAGFFVVYNASKMSPWISWEDTHSHFNRANQYPATIWRQFPNAVGVDISRWIYVLCAILFFAFFGFAEEARRHYCLTIEFLLKITGIRVSHQTKPHEATWQPDPDLLTPPNKRRRANSFVTTSKVSICPDSRLMEKEDEWTPSGVALHSTQDYAHVRLGSRTSPLLPTASPIPPLSILSWEPAPRAIIESKT